MRLLSRGRSPMRRAPRNCCASAATRCWWYRCSSTQTIEADFAGPYGAVLMTSANAARAVSSHPRVARTHELPVFAVGDAQRRGRACGGFRRRDVGGRCARRSRPARRGALRRNVREGCSISRARIAPAILRASSRRMASRSIPSVDLSRGRGRSAFRPELAQALSSAQLDGVLHYSRRSVATLIGLGRAGRRS